MLTEIDHVAIAVHDLEAAIEYYRATYGVEPVHRERIEKDGVDEALIKVADSYIQLLTPTRDDSPVAKFLAAKGEGMHHVGYRVDSCADATPDPAEAANGVTAAASTASPSISIERRMMTDPLRRKLRLLRKD